MANMHLVTGYAGQEHITATDQGAFNAALIGRDQFVLDVGNVLEAQVISNNQIRILDGELMMQGRFVRLNPDTYVDLNIDNGTQGMKRNDLIAARYTKNASTGVEEVNLVVIKGTAADSNPVDPAYTEGDLSDGTTALHDFPLWRIPLDGLNVGEPVALFGDPFMDSMRTLPEIRQAVNQIHAEVDKKIALLNEYTKEEVLTTDTKTLYGLEDSAVPDNVFNLIKTLLDDAGTRAKIVTGSYTGTNPIHQLGGSSNLQAKSLTFDSVPKVIFLWHSNKNWETRFGAILCQNGYLGFVGLRGTSEAEDYAYETYAQKVTVSGTTVSWIGCPYSGGYDDSSGSKVYYYYMENFNTIGNTYYYAAIL